MKIIEHADAEALSWPVGSIQYVGDEPWIVRKKVRGPEPRVELVERDEWFLATCMLTPFVSFKIGERELRAQAGQSCADFLALIRQAMLDACTAKRLIDEVKRQCPPPGKPEATPMPGNGRAVG